MRLVTDEPGAGKAEDASLPSSPGVEPVGGFQPDGGNGAEVGVSTPEQAASVSPGSPSELLAQIQELREQNAMLRAEVSHLRRRDDTVNYTIARIDEELRLAARLQQDFMPRVMPVVGNIRFHTLFRPATYVSGDLYDVSRLDERHVGFYMADAVGHGMPAALLTMFMRQALQTKEITSSSYRLLRPSETLKRMNEVLVEQELSEATFATAVCGLINTETGQLLVSSAGHPRPLIIPTQGEAIELETEGSLLGIFPDEKFSDVEYQLRPGDRLVLYTDGVEVAFRLPALEPTQHEVAPGRSLSFHKEPMFDNDRWKRELVALRELSCEEQLVRFSSEIDAQDGSLSPSDDLTVILVEMTEG
jgi:serine phosphatase RsbU (regulator of sigma subunit)